MKQYIKKIIAAICSGTSYVTTSFPRVYFDTDRNQLSGGSTYKLNLPSTMSAANFWVISINNGKNAAGHQHDQPLPGTGSLNKLNYNEDGTVDLYFGPELPKGILKSNYLKTMPGNSWSSLLRFSYTAHTIFSQTWHAGDFEKIK